MNHLILFALSIFGLLLSSCFSSVFGLGTVNDTFNIDVNLKDRSPGLLQFNENDDWYEFPKNYELDVKNSSIVCPSNNCKSTSDLAFIIHEDDRYMSLGGDLKLVDDKSNGQLTPKKQKLIEQMTFRFICYFQDIQEDIVKNTTKYICSEPDSGSINRDYNNTYYPYTFTATFELPSRHLVLNATEAHEQTLFSTTGHVVFKDKDGKIVVK